ncbi:hypothetical protein CANCADRAFT_135280 [Tortispora caseinolytica NRRL Y-17796]|uniref:Phosducin thioredoxin-like domain-containing protein n=1 Tax=Tortispora caseinolytica NRRL Y-17796 TaxID=767744 RepID=A0A1E4TBX6_9ASCO|nr:hypothetical protein CANCADRAFT_135280 [Tortispora caseinolytica NRRL Y-17796]
MDPIATFKQTFEDDNSDIEIDNLLDEDVYNYESQRRDQLASHLAQLKKYRDAGNGSLVNYTNERDLMQTCIDSDRTIVHYKLNSFERCRILSEHLEKLAQKHWESKFIEISVENAPFLVAKLDIKTLPVLIGYNHQQETFKLVGFDKLGNKDSFATADLERLLVKSNLLHSDPLH